MNSPTVKERENVFCDTCLSEHALGVGIYNSKNILISLHCIKCARSIAKALYFGTFCGVNLGSS